MTNEEIREVGMAISRYFVAETHHRTRQTVETVTALIEARAALKKWQDRIILETRADQVSNDS